MPLRQVEKRQTNELLEKFDAPEDIHDFERVRTEKVALRGEALRTKCGIVGCGGRMKPIREEDEDRPRKDA